MNLAAGPLCPGRHRSLPVGQGRLRSPPAPPGRNARRRGRGTHSSRPRPRTRAHLLQFFRRHARIHRLQSRHDSVIRQRLRRRPNMACLRSGRRSSPTRPPPSSPTSRKTTCRDFIHQYRANRTWPQRSLITPESFNAMRDILIDGGLVKTRHPYGPPRPPRVRPPVPRNGYR